MRLDDSGFPTEDSEHIYKNDDPMCNQSSLSYLNYDDNFSDDDRVYHYDYDASYDFDHYDYIDDIQLKPRSTHKPKSMRCKNKPLQPQLSLKKSPRPLPLPSEILEVVCAYLSQITLRHCASLVSKEWNRVCNRYIRRVGVWKALGKDFQQQLLDQIPKLNTLDIWYDMDPGVYAKQMQLIDKEYQSMAWSRFGAAITAPFENQSQDDHAPKCLLHHIRYMTFQGLPVQFAEYIEPLMDRFQFLLTLTIDVRRDSSILPLFRLLDKSPALLELYITGRPINSSRIISGDADDQIVDLPEPPINPETAYFPRKPKEVIPPAAYPEQYRLQIFECTNVIIRPRILERIITTCPNLRIFKAYRFRIRSWNEHQYIARFSPERLIAHAKDRCPKLEWYAVKEWMSCQPNGEYLQQISMYFPETKFLSFIDQKHYVSFLNYRSTRATLSQITVLEFSNLNCAYSETVNKILCLTPHLLHLITTKLPFRTSVLYFPDIPLFPERIHSRKRLERAEKRRRRQIALARFQTAPLSSSITDDASPLPDIPQVWQCRDLCTLDLGFGSLSNNTFELKIFSAYVSQNRLFNNLTSLKLGIRTLKIGQRRSLRSIDKRARAHGQTSRHRSGSDLHREQEHQQHLREVVVERFRDDLAPLRGLRSLELLSLRTAEFPGFVAPSDFEFLRPKSTKTVVSFLENSGCTGNDEQLKGEGNKGDRPMDETVWPRLHAFHIWHKGYEEEHFRLSIKDVQKIRPSVEFRIEQDDFYIEESMNPEGSIMLLNYRADGITPYFTIFKYGPKETKVVCLHRTSLVFSTTESC
ncbi:hypothetical protein BGZ50_008826 [Haplosporangium sp. Z 11]|nr:hypothetical protein BGZ50_008826 [Haplosporangium sp. Z 11]